MNAYSSNHSSFLEAGFTIERGKPSQSLALATPASGIHGADSLPAFRKGTSLLLLWPQASCSNSDPEHISQPFSQERLVGAGAAPVSDSHEERIRGVDGSRQPHASMELGTLITPTRYQRPRNPLVSFISLARICQIKVLQDCSKYCFIPSFL